MIATLVWMFWTSIYIFLAFLAGTWMYRMYDLDENDDGEARMSKRGSWFSGPGNLVSDAVDRMNHRGGERSRNRNTSRDRSRDMNRDRMDRHMNKSVNNMDRTMDRNMDRTMERTMDTSMDRTMDRNMDRTMNRPMDRNLHQAMDNTMDNNTDRTMDRSMDRNLDRSMNRTMDRNMDRSMDRSRERSRERTLDRTMDKAMARNNDRSIERTRDRSMDRNMDRAMGTNMESSRERSMDMNISKTMDRNTGRSMERNRDRSMDRNMERTMTRSIDRNMERFRERTMDNTMDRNRERSMDRSREQSVDRNIKRSRRRSMDRNMERSMDRNMVRSMENARERSTERNSGRTMDNVMDMEMKMDQVEKLDCMDRSMETALGRNMERMEKLNRMDIDRMDRPTERLVRSRSNSIRRVQSETRCEEKVNRSRSNSVHRVRCGSRTDTEQDTYTSAMGGFRSKKMLHGKTVIVMYGHTGIGYETSKDLARRGARVIIACRNRDRGMVAARKIMADTGNKNMEVRICDLGSLKSVREFAREVNSTLDKVDILVNYAGNPRTDQRMSQDGYDLTLQTNHFALFLLTNLIKETMDRSDERRIINVSSLAAREIMEFGSKIDYNSIVKGRPFASDNWNDVTYATSKFMNCLFSAEIPRRWKGYKSYTLHPGDIRTDIFNEKMNMPYNRQYVPLVRGRMNVALLYGETPRQGADCVIFCCLDDNLDGGDSYSDMRTAFDSQMREQNYKKEAMYSRNHDITDPEMGSELWDFSARLVDL